MSSMAKLWKHPDSGIYYHRIEVPSDIRDIVGKHWIKNSLKTRNFSEAKRLFALQYAETQARDRVSLTPKDIEILSQRWFEQALSEIEDEGVSDRYIVRYEGDDITYNQVAKFTMPLQRDPAHDPINLAALGTLRIH